MKHFYRLPFLVFVFFSASLWSCENEFEKHYEKPDWLKGTTIETLEAKGNFSLFIEAMRVSGYDMTVSQGANTVFAPTDEAFDRYLSKKGYSSVSDIPKPDLKALIATHILSAPYSKEQMLSSSVWAPTGPDSDSDTSPWGEIGARTFKKTSYYKPENRVVEYEGRNILENRWNKSVPIFSDEFVAELKISSSDYTYFYPDKEWGGFNFAGSKITESEIPSNNGYIYVIDEVVEPLRNLDDILHQEQNFSLFASLADRFERYYFYSLDFSDPTAQQRDSLFLKSFGSTGNGDTYALVDIANERIGTNETNTSFSAEKLHHCIFVPSNDVLQAYLDQTVLKYYPSLEEVPDLVLYYLVQGHMVEKNMAWPSVLSSIGLYNYFGDQIDINPDADVSFREMGSNGGFYGMDKVLPAKVFTSVSGPVLFNKDYSIFMQMLGATEQLTSLSKDEANYVLLVPENDLLKAKGYDYSKSLGKVLVLDTESGELVPAEKEDLPAMTDFLKRFIVYSDDVDLSGKGFFKTAEGMYLSYENNKIFGGGNMENGEAVDVLNQAGEGTNGKAYQVSAVPEPASKNVSQAILTDDRFSDFNELAQAVGAIDNGWYYFLIGGEFTAFIPSNEAMAKARVAGTIPETSEYGTLTDEQKADLLAFVRYFFVANQYAFTDGKNTGTFETARIDKERSDNFDTYYENVMVKHDGAKLYIENATGATAAVQQGDILASDGVVHILEDILVFDE
ncbi:fasciclin domain-containing protein [Fulvitalea axinellae]